MDTSWGYGQQDIQNDTDALVSEKTNVNFEPPQILVNRKSFGQMSLNSGTCFEGNASF
jgi:hypothetical protein